MEYQKPPIEAPLNLTPDGRISNPTWILWLQSLMAASETIETILGHVPIQSSSSLVRTEDDFDSTALLNTPNDVQSSQLSETKNDDLELQIVMQNNQSNVSTGFEFWPIGSVFLSVLDTSPASLLGFGTWVRIAEGQLLAGFKTADTDFGTVEGTGGAKTATHDHNHDGSTVANHSAWTHASGGAHTHDDHGYVSSKQGTNTGTVLIGPATHESQGGHTHDEHAALTHTVTQPTAHSDHSILPPYCTIYVWKRTA